MKAKINQLINLVVRLRDQAFADELISACDSVSHSGSLFDSVEAEPLRLNMPGF